VIFLPSLDRANFLATVVENKWLGGRVPFGGPWGSAAKSFSELLSRAGGRNLESENLSDRFLRGAPYWRALSQLPSIAGGQPLKPDRSLLRHGRDTRAEPRLSRDNSVLSTGQGRHDRLATEANGLPGSQRRLPAR